MRPVTREQFYAVVGPMNVTPKVDVNSLKFRIHVSKWLTQHRELVGTSFSDSWGISPTTYQLEGRWAQAH